MFDGETCRRTRDQGTVADVGESERLKAELEECKGRLRQEKEERAKEAKEAVSLKAGISKLEARLESSSKTAIEKYLKSPDHAKDLRNNAARWVYRAAAYCRRVCHNTYKLRSLKALDSEKVVRKVQKSFDENRVILSDDEASSEGDCDEADPAEDLVGRKTSGTRSPSPGDDYLVE